jgi:signal transduction histidine kinase
MTLSRLSNTEPQLQPNLQTINVGQFIKTRIHSLSPSTVSIQQELDDTVMLAIVPTHLQLVVDNLINNALYYAQHQVDIQLQCVGEQGFILKVSDDGVGIDEKDKLLVFMPFYRSDESRDRKTGGFGLGLALVKAVAKRYHWEVQVNNRANGGACFEVTYVAG